MEYQIKLKSKVKPCKPVKKNEQNFFPGDERFEQAFNSYNSEPK
jgi:hypothetical protein